MSYFNTVIIANLNSLSLSEAEEMQEYSRVADVSLQCMSFNKMQLKWRYLLRRFIIIKIIVVILAFVCFFMWLSSIKGYGIYM